MNKEAKIRMRMKEEEEDRKLKAKKILERFSSKMPKGEKVSGFFKPEVILKNYNSIHEQIFTRGIFSLKELGLPLFSDFSDMEIRRNFKTNHDKLVKLVINLDIKKFPEIYIALSCIFGAFLGDAMGAYCKFQESNKNLHNQIYKGKPQFGEVVGQVTDNSEMAMSFAYSMMDHSSFDKLMPSFSYYYYGCWKYSHPKDMGDITTKALLPFLFQEGISPWDSPKIKDYLYYVSDENKESISNEFLVRKTSFVVAIFFKANVLIGEAFNDELLVNTAALRDLYFIVIKNDITKDNLCTHPSEKCNSIQAFFTFLTLLAMCSKGSKEVIYIATVFYKSNEFLNSATQEDVLIAQMFHSYLKIFRKEKDFDVWNFFTDEESVCDEMESYMNAFKLSIYYLVKLFDYSYKKTPTFETIMNEICDFGGDTSTNCAIVGSIIGSLIGYKDFGYKFWDMMIATPPGRELYSPILMVNFVDYFSKYHKPEFCNYIKGYENLSFIYMIFIYLYGEFDPEKFF